MKRRRFLTIPASASALALAGQLVADAAAGGRQTRTDFDIRWTEASPGASPVPAIDPRTAALLVLDYQTAWIETLTDTDVLLDRAAQAIAVARDHGMQVAYARVAFTPADYAAVPAGNLIFTALSSRPVALDDDAPRTAIDPRVAPAPEDKVVRKTRVGTFARTDLDEWLRALRIDTLILAGISTSGVVLSTVCDGADRDYRLVVLSDACADQDPEIHNLLIRKVFPQRARVISVAQLPDVLLAI